MRRFFRHSGTASADINFAGTNLKSQTTLHIAAQYGNIEAISELIASSTNIYAQFPNGKPALEVAAQRVQIKAASILIDHGMDPLHKFDGMLSAVYLSAVHGKTEMLQWFLDRYKDHMGRPRQRLVW
ncbi:hypothetical protein MGYG_01987 [Nannizzia gypsea CBS 118893]|uniref:Uncharacterized protein n=1 Tax=Arthroderma gypseum (strain ATCC MYA-4604 / CBS 118893) TaxID=535722 RepID=E5QZH0_ARTGP|nr:hypothetical protein MGYG_01987 [Nannizzia gypsea CBS 118893]EFQ98975.1 hypothetical protein MGYG_01987 [Nannizzia gypsea CBS 118893]